MEYFLSLTAGIKTPEWSEGGRVAGAQRGGADGAGGSAAGQSLAVPLARPHDTPESGPRGPAPPAKDPEGGHWTCVSLSPFLFCLKQIPRRAKPPYPPGIGGAGSRGPAWRARIKERPTTTCRASRRRRRGKVRGGDKAGRGRKLLSSPPAAPSGRSLPGPAPSSPPSPGAGRSLPPTQTLPGRASSGAGPPPWPPRVPRRVSAVRSSAEVTRAEM